MIRTRHPGATRPTCLTAVVLLLTLLTGAASSTATADTTALVPDPDRSSTVVAGAWTFTGLTAQTLGDFISANNARIVDLEVDNATGPTFTVTLVQNIGVYSRSWQWYYNQTAAQVASKLSSYNGRLVTVSPYTVNGTRLFAFAMVANTGTAQKSWWWYYDTTTPAIGAQLSNHGARLVDLSSYFVNGVKRYAAVLISNSGVDGSAWWWSIGATPASIASQLSSNHARLLDLVHNDDGTLDVVMVANAVSFASWYYDQTLTDVRRLTSQYGMRVVAVDSYVSSGVKRLAVSMVNDLDDESTRLREIIRPGVGNAAFGFYIQHLTGAKVLGLQEHTVFEPASAIKVVHYAYTLAKAQAGTEELGNYLTFYRAADAAADSPNICPNPVEETAATAVKIELDSGLFALMNNSDNRMARALQLRYTNSALTSWAQSLGMSSTNIRQIMGCGFQGGVRNDATLTDTALLYASVQRGILLSGFYRDIFFHEILSGGVWPTLHNVIVDEAHKVGKDAVVQAFEGGVRWWGKGGAYDLAATGGYNYIRTDGALIQFPFKSGTATQPGYYALGRWINNLIVSCTDDSNCPTKTNADNAFEQLRGEMWRTVVRNALSTW